MHQRSEIPTGGFPLSAAQRGIWFAQHVAGSAPISIAQYVELVGPVDMEILRASVRQAGREFGTGYLRLVEIDDQPFQVVDTSLHDTIDSVDFRGEPDPDAAAQSWMQAEYSAPLDLLNDRLVNLAFLQLADDRWLWYSRIHHIVLDGMGAMAMLQRAGELYNAGLEGAAAPPSKADELVKIVDADVAYRSSDRFKADREHWLSHLTGMADPVSLAGRTADVDTHPSVVSGSLPAATAELMDAFAKAQSSSVAPIVVAAFGAYVGAMTGAAEVMLSLPVSARTTATMRRSGGMIANVVPLRLTLDPRATVGELIRAAQSELTGALRRQRYRQEDIFRDLGWTMDEAASFGPSVNLMMVDTRIQLGSVTGRLHVLTSGLIDDLFLNLYPGIGGESTHIDFQANPNLYGDDELSGHHQRFLVFLHRFLERGGDASLVSIDALTGDDHQRLLPARGGVSMPGSTLPEILAAGVSVDPDAVALVSGDVRMTYREVDEYSNRLARQLIASGIGPERTVAIAIPRSIESVLAFWAVGKTGAAFVPVDPTYPADRIEHMITDSAVAGGVTVASARNSLPDTVNWLVIDDPSFVAKLDSVSAGAVTTPLHIDQTAYVI
jgi:hypothetical protein